MKRVSSLFILLTCLMVSCYEPYFPETESAGRELVVNGLITNEHIPYHINLSYAESFDSTSAGLPVSGAQVTVTDGHGNHYLFEESESGDYVSNPSRFAGTPGYTYILHIITQDGYQYESNPQLLTVDVDPGKFYPEYDYREVISKQNGTFSLTHGAKILTDIENQTDSIPRFRFASHLVTQYFYTICPMFQSCYLLYCWQSEEANSDINLTGGDYAVNSASISRHEICFIADNPTCYALRYTIGAQNPDGSIKPIVTTEYQNYNIHNRLLFINRYRLNNEAYAYYKSMDKQLKSDGKLFDPIAVQIAGNIKCTSNQGKKVFGFFEASSVGSSAFLIDFRNLVNDQPSIKAIQYVLPPEQVGCIINTVPAFWIN